MTAEESKQPDVGGLTPYERCVATIEGRPTDRVPAYTPTFACEVSSKILGREVHTGSPSLWYTGAQAWMKGEEAFKEFDAGVTESNIELNRVLGIEVIRFGYRRIQRPSRQLDELTFLYGDPDGVHQIWQWDPVVRNYYRIADTAPRPPPESWPERARRQRKSLAAALEGAKGAGIWEAELQKRLGAEMMVVGSGGGFSVGVDEAGLMACVLEPGAVADMLDLQLELNLARADAVVGRGIKVALGGGDMADKNGPMYSPRVFHELMVPRLAKFAAYCREIGLHYAWRTDGNVWPIADMVFEEAGVPGFGEVDFDAGMEAGKLRARFPELVIWGNVSSNCLHRRSAAEVYDHCMAILEGSGGTRHFHGCSNAILPGTPPENVLAMMRARDDFSRQA